MSTPLFPAAQTCRPGPPPSITPPLSPRHQLYPYPGPEMPPPTQEMPSPFCSPQETSVSLPSQAFPMTPCLLSCVTFFLIAHPRSPARFLRRGSWRSRFVPLRYCRTHGIASSLTLHSWGPSLLEHRDQGLARPASPAPGTQ